MAAENTIFALFAVSNAAAVQSRLDSNLMPFTMLSQKVSGDSWFFIASPAITTKEVCDALGITDGTSGTGVVVRVENYFGRSNPALWEWLAAKRGVDLAQSQVP